MLPQLIDRSTDLRRLYDDGYDLELRGSYLVIRGVPYVDGARVVRYGTLVSALSLAGDVTTRPDTHVVFFAGSYPCHRDGTAIEQLRHQSAHQTLVDTLTVEHTFSNKPAAGYADYYEKMTTYVGIISGPAMALDPTASPRRRHAEVEAQQALPFVYPDAGTARYGITPIVDKLRGLRVAIVGVGGTGSYILDLVAKTPVKEIHLYDADEFVSHNAFRSPGAASLDDVRRRINKADYFAGIYRRIHQGVVSHPYSIDADNVAQLSTADHVFVCVDKGSARQAILQGLSSSSASVIDVGMGVEVVDNALLGVVRATVIAKTTGLASTGVPVHDDMDDMYHAPIQIADLNMLNAAMAVIKWKKLAGVYQDLECERNMTYSVNVNMLANDARQT